MEATNTYKEGDQVVLLKDMYGKLCDGSGLTMDFPAGTEGRIAEIYNDSFCEFETYFTNPRLKVLDMTSFACKIRDLKRV